MFVATVMIVYAIINMSEYYSQLRGIAEYCLFRILISKLKPPLSVHASAGNLNARCAELVPLRSTSYSA